MLAPRSEKISTFIGTWEKGQNLILSWTYNLGLLYHTFVHGISMLAFGLVIFRPAMTDRPTLFCSRTYRMPSCESRFVNSESGGFLALSAYVFGSFIFRDFLTLIVFKSPFA